MHVSVIIPVRNNIAGLRTCLAALHQQTYPAEQFEIIVVDNGSTEDVRILQPEFPRVIFLSDAGPGSYSARNRGLKAAQGRVIAFTDSDCIPDPTWVENGVHAIATNGATILGGDVVFLDAADRSINACEVLEVIASGLPNIKHLIETRGFAPTANVFTTRAFVNRVGEFDATLKSGGDTEWAHRAKAKGEKLAFAEGVVVRHPRRSTFDALALKYKRQVGGGVNLLRRKNPSAFKILLHVLTLSPLDPRTYLVAIIAPQLRGHGLGLRLRFFGVALAMSAVLTAEKIRVLSGGDANRG